MAKFTIVTPVLNGADFIEGCILSVAAQEENVQHIVMDGGSTDGTQDIIAKHANLLAHWESKADAGQSDAINRGLALADGEYCNWLNADDTLCEGALTEVSRLFASDVDVVTGKCAHVRPSGEVLTVGGTTIYSTLEQTLGRYSMGQPSHFYRTSVVKAFGGLNPELHLAMDMELWFRYLLQHGQHRVAGTERTLSRFMVHDAAKSTALADGMRAERFTIFSSLLRNVQKPSALERWLNSQSKPFALPMHSAPPLDTVRLLGHFAFPLLTDAYTQRDPELLKALLECVNSADLLTPADRILWELRLLKIRTTG